MNKVRKITLSGTIIDDIVSRRKQLGLSAYALSGQAVKSKYWLANIESGKTHAISYKNLFSLYKVLLPEKSDYDIDLYMENLIDSTIENKCESLKDLLLRLDKIEKNVSCMVEQFSSFSSETGIRLGNMNGLIAELEEKKKEIKIQMHECIDTL